jgi:hypothetical protein
VISTNLSKKTYSAVMAKSGEPTICSEKNRTFIGHLRHSSLKAGNRTFIGHIGHYPWGLGDAHIIITFVFKFSVI